MSVNVGGEQVVAEVLKEKALSITDVKKRVREFLKRRHIAERLSAEDYSRLYGLQEALVEEERQRRPKQKRSDISKTEVEVAEPDRKRRRRQCIT